MENPWRPGFSIDLHITLVARLSSCHTEMVYPSSENKVARADDRDSKKHTIKPEKFGRSCDR